MAALKDHHEGSHRFVAESEGQSDNTVTPINATQAKKANMSGKNTKVAPTSGKSTDRADVLDSLSRMVLDTIESFRLTQSKHQAGTAES